MSDIGAEERDSVVCVESEGNSRQRTPTWSSVTSIRNQHELTRCFGYGGSQHVYEVEDLAVDFYGLHDL